MTIIKNGELLLLGGLERVSFIFPYNKMGNKDPN